MANSTLPSTPTHHPASSSSPSSASASTSTASTTVERAKPSASSMPPPASDATSILDLVDSSSDDGMPSTAHSNDEDMRDAHRDDSPTASKRTDVNSATNTLKRKGKDAPPSAQPAAKKSKASSIDKGKGKDKGETGNKDGDKIKALVELKGNKFDCKQKPLQVNVTMSYLGEMAAFLDFADKHLSSSSDAVLDDWPEAHHPLIAKLVHESPLQLDGVYRAIKRVLAPAITSAMGTLADSQESNAEEITEAQVSARIPTAPLKALITSLATRTNYGLAINDVDDFPEGVQDVPAGLQIWCWEVKDEEHWPAEMRAKLERRKREREEVKATAVALFHALSDEEQAAILSAPDAKSKGKGKAKADDGDEADGEKKPKGKGKGKVKAEDGEGAEEKPKVKKKKEKKELTEDEKREAEEKARVKAEKEAEKEAKRKERDEKRAKKVEEDAKKLERKVEKGRAKAEKEEEERRKIQAKKKQTNMFTSFFNKAASSPAPEQAGPSASPKPGKAKESDFDRVFHPFTIRDKVTVAPVNQFRKEDAPKVEIKFDSVPDLTLKDSLASFLSTASPRRIPAYDPHPAPPVNVRQCVVAINDSTLTSSDASAYYKLLEDRSKVRVKFFKFHADVRPGYIGTWTKISHVVGPRTPLARETALLNYDVDSEGEWEEEVDDPDAEDVGSDGARSDEEGEAGAESEADSWLAEDDEIEYEEGYDADGDAVMLAAEGRAPDDDEDVIVVEGDKERRKRERDTKKRKAERDRKKKERETKRGPMLPVTKGVCWQRDVEVVEDAVFKPMRIHFLNDASFGLNPFAFVSKPFATQAAAATAASGIVGASAKGKGKENIAIAAAPSPAAKAPVSTPAAAPAANGTVNTLKAKRAPPKQPFPAEHLARFVRHVHGSSKSRALLVDAFVEMMKEEGVALNKNTVDAKYRDLAVKKVKGVAKVADDVLAQVGIPADA